MALSGEDGVEGREKRAAGGGTGRQERLLWSLEAFKEEDLHCIRVWDFTSTRSCLVDFVERSCKVKASGWRPTWMQPSRSS